MKCIECNGNQFEMDERLGELSCIDCGYIAVTELFEQSVRYVSDGEVIHSPTKLLGSKPNSMEKNWLKSANSHLARGLNMCNILLASLMVNHPLKDRVEECYSQLYRKNVLTNYGIEEKATAVVYYVLRENRTPVSLKELKQEFSCNTRTLNRAIKRINKHYNNVSAYNKIDPLYKLKQVTSKITDELNFASNCQEVLELFEPLTQDTDWVKETPYYASICWIAKNIYLHPIKQQEIAKKASVSSSQIKLTTKKLLALIGYEKCSQVRGKNINELRRN
tara:strand:+ start:707 stop:1540 length:834 start_codon:yes stop_codon:yes gene_type:complete